MQWGQIATGEDTLELNGREGLGDKLTLSAPAAHVPGPGPGTGEGGEPGGAVGPSDLGAARTSKGSQQSSSNAHALQQCLVLFTFRASSAAPSLPLAQISLMLQPNSDTIREGNLGKHSSSLAKRTQNKRKGGKSCCDFLSNFLVL